ncbi:MAG: hypothetical protein Q8Q39_01560, partial [bacterium]|nr:hypothetical protein [bacterium]
MNHKGGWDMCFRRFVFAITALFLFLGSSASGQERKSHVAILATGSGSFGSFTSLGGSNDLAGRRTEGFHPGFELQFNPHGRITPSFAYVPMSFRQATYHNGATGSFGYQNPDGTFGTVTMPPGVEFVSYDQTTNSKLRGLIGALQVNLLTGSIRPYIAGGGGIGLVETTKSYTETFHPLFLERNPNARSSSGSTTTRHSTILGKAVFGVMGSAGHFEIGGEG